MSGLSAPSGWEEVLGIQEVPEGGMGAGRVGEKEILVARVSGELFAVDDACPHQGASLAAGTLEDKVVVCPLHAWKFYLTDGTPAIAAPRGLACFPVRENGGRFEIQIG